MPAAPSLPESLITLGARLASKEEAIRESARMLSGAGCVTPDYADSMVRREGVANTFLGHGVAIPHGLGEDRGLVRRDGIAVIQLPGGVEWNPGQVARLVIGIAAKSDSHMEILKRLTRLLQDEVQLANLFSTTDASVISAALTENNLPAASKAPAGDLAERLEWVVDYPTGLHARPASSWAETAQTLGVPIQVRHDQDVADATKLLALLQLGLRHGDRVVFSAEGKDARAALQRFRSTVTRLTGQEQEVEKRARAKPQVRGWNPPDASGRVFEGIAASPGLAVGSLLVMRPDDRAVEDRPEPLPEGAALLSEAVGRTKATMRALVEDTTRRLGASEAKIFKAQATLLDDTDLVTLACQLMVAGHGVAWAWAEAVTRMADRLSALGNPVLSARAADLRDVGRRVLLQIDPRLERRSVRDLSQPGTVIVANDLSPSDTAELNPELVVGLATAQGGPTAHTAILARTMGLPAMVAGGSGLLALPDGTQAIVDGDAGRLYVEPSLEMVVSARAWIAALAEKRAAEESERSQPARTRDGHSMQVAANVNRPDQVAEAISLGAEGVGLMRTEFLFLERGDPPSEDEQYETYRGMISALGDRPLIIRTLDIGGDKQVAHLDLPHEQNPFLGVRGARLLLRRPDLLEPQLRALYRAAKGGGALSIMFPMITSLPEVTALRAHCERIRNELGAPSVPLGIMVEVPAAALQADVLAPHVDFFSIGTNDLTQYALAMDRQNHELAADADPLHPAVLRLIRLTVDGARPSGKWVGVCGGLAGDPLGAALLTGLGVSELSMTPRDVPTVKARLRASSLVALKGLAAKALNLETAAQVRELEGELS